MTEPTPPKTFPSIQGRCPACRGDSLFIGSGGYVTCSRLDCPNPALANDLLHHLHEGTETTEGHDPAVVHTDGQWLYRFLHATPAQRLDVIHHLREHAARGSQCFLMGHEKRAEEDRQAWGIVARVRALRDSWRLMTLEPGQVRRLLDELTAALADEPARTTPNNPPISKESTP
jgi:hypothetical protein